MANVGLQSPWVTTYNKIRVLLNRDSDLTISRLSGDDNGVYTFTVSSTNAPKIIALEKIIKNEFVFGNVTLKIQFLVENPEKDGITVDDFKNAFNGNNIISKIETVKNPVGVPQTFVMFGREVIQFYNDDISDFYGNFNGLGEDIAREIFNPVDASISYCTDIVPCDR